MNDIEIEELNKNVFGKENNFNLELLWQIVDLLDNIEFINNGDYFIIDNKIVDINMVETIFNIYAQNNFKNYNIVVNDTEKKSKRMKEFIDEIQNGTITVKIFDNARDMINYVFIEGQDKEQILNGFINVIKNNNLKLNEYNVYPNVYRVEDKYIYIF